MELEELNWIAEGRLQEYLHSQGVKISYKEELEAYEGRLWRPSSYSSCRSAILSLASGGYKPEEILRLNFGLLTTTEIMGICAEGRETPKSDIMIIFGYRIKS